jgi:hypothetical protein
LLTTYPSARIAVREKITYDTSAIVDEFSRMVVRDPVLTGNSTHIPLSSAISGPARNGIPAPLALFLDSEAAS